MGPKITALHLKSLIGVIVKPAAKNLLHLLLQVAGHVAERVEHLHLLLLGIIALILILVFVDVKMSADGLYTDLQGVYFEEVSFNPTILSLRNRVRDT